MFEISVTGRFRATHHLCRPDGASEPPHSHDWRVTVTLAGRTLNPLGVLVDFLPVRQRLDALRADLSDRDLNDVPAFGDRAPSAEHVALHIGERLARDLPLGVRLRSVEVEEEPGCIARYLPDEGGDSAA